MKYKPNQKKLRKAPQNKEGYTKKEKRNKKAYTRITTPTPVTQP